MINHKSLGEALKEILVHGERQYILGKVGTNEHERFLENIAKVQGALDVWEAIWPELESVPDLENLKEAISHMEKHETPENRMKKWGWYLRYILQSSNAITAIQEKMNG